MGAGVVVGLGKQTISDISTNYKEHKFDFSEWERSSARDYIGSAAGMGVAFPLSLKSPVAAAGAKKFTETLIKEQSFGYALSEGLETTIKAGVLKGVNSGIGKLADAAEVDIDILGKVIEKLPSEWGGKIGTVADRINGNKEIIKKIGEANFNYDISFGFLMEYKVVSSIKSSIKSNIKKHPREYIETKIETKLEKKRINDIFCPA